MPADVFIKVTINNESVKAEKDMTILKAAESFGIKIPTLCHHDELESFGACRLCLVEVVKNGKKSLVASCVHPVEEGIQVRTNTEEVLKARQFVLELMLAETPNVPGLRKLAKEYHIEKSRYTALEDKPRECLLCGLCVRVCRDKVKANVLTFAGRSSECQVTTAFGRPLDEKICTTCKECVVICPVESNYKEQSKGG